MILGKLTQLGSTGIEPVPIEKEKFVIGRHSECDLHIADNKNVSQNHCFITFEDGGKVYLTDTSTNGTMVDGNKVKHAKIQLKHGDEIHLVFRKNGAGQNLAYIYQEIEKTMGDTLERTQEYVSVSPELDEPSDEPPVKKFRPKEESKSDTNPVVCQSQSSSKVSGVAAMEDNLLCSICQDILHDCVSLQPCLHTFCAGCYSSWMTQSSACPTCRKKVTTVAKNHLLNNLTDNFLQAHPEKKRLEKDLAELDKQNIIKENVVKVGLSRSYAGDDDDDEEYDDADGEESEDEPMYMFATSAPPPLPMSLPMCRECFGYLDPPSRYTSPPTTSAQLNGTPTFQCESGRQSHLVCYCCMELMPDRTRQAGAPPQKCEVCDCSFCHAYFGCRKAGCRGCLVKLKDLNLDDSVLDNVLMQNVYESNVLKEYLRGKSMNAKDLLQTGCMKLDDNEYQLDNSFGGRFVGKNIQSSSIVCYRCGMKAMRQLAFQFRKNILSAELPDEVTNKPNCYWGENCRTQTKVHHANKFNHICEQTRWN